MKSSASGGIDPWDTSRYLNIWVVADGGAYIGWAEFPGAAANHDGVVIRHPYIGDTGTVRGTYAGRTATHEVGHWLNLLHIWGEDGCGADDPITDTPHQDKSNEFCPTHPHPSCLNAGDMFMNYMDYVDDPCMALFTVGQRDFMHAALAVARPGLLASDWLVPPPAGHPASQPSGAVGAVPLGCHAKEQSTCGRRRVFRHSDRGGCARTHRMRSQPGVERRHVGAGAR